MSEAIHSRGSGRSGPKRKTGCLTCRRRKVRCDEERPLCANCHRLRLDCIYSDSRGVSQHSSASPSNIPPGPHSFPTSAPVNLTFQGPLPLPTRTTEESSTTANPLEYPSLDPEPGQLWSFDNGYAPAYAYPFQDVFMSSLDSFDVNMDFTSSPNFADHDLPRPRSNPLDSTTNPPSPPPPSTENGTQTLPERDRKSLVEYFVKSANPIAVTLPTHSEWTSACRSLLLMAEKGSCLCSAICALAALHLYTAKGSSDTSAGRLLLDDAFDYYCAASDEVNLALDRRDVENKRLRVLFATLFLLTHVELMAQADPHAKQKQWPLQNLANAHHRVRDHSDRIRSWTGNSKRMLTWMTLLQTKAEYNSGDYALESASAPLSSSVGDPFARTSSTREDGWSSSFADQADADCEEDTRTAAELAYDTMNQPAFDFFLKSNAFTSRIIGLDVYHRTRGTLPSELSTLQDGQHLSTDLHALWVQRPATLTFLADPSALETALQPPLARRLILNLRVYLSNYLAQFIYLHRAAFRAYPATPDVSSATARVVRLARDISADAHAPATPPTLPTSPPHPALPSTMLWPLFLAATECSAADRGDVLAMMREIAAPNAAKTIFLLEEVLRRQDREGRRVDHRVVREDLFEGVLSVLY